MIPPHEIRAAVDSGGPGWTPFRGRTLPLVGLTIGIVLLMVGVGDVAGARREAGAGGGLIGALFGSGIIAGSVSALRAGRNSQYGEQLAEREEDGETVTVIPQRARWGAAVFSINFGAVLTLVGVLTSLAEGEWELAPISLGVPLIAAGAGFLLSPKKRRPEPILLGPRGLGVVFDEERRWFSWSGISGAERWHKEIYYRGSRGTLNFILIRDADAAPLLGLKLGELGIDYDQVVRLLAEYWERYHEAGSEAEAEEPGAAEPSASELEQPDAGQSIRSSQPSQPGRATPELPSGRDNFSKRFADGVQRLVRGDLSSFARRNSDLIRIGVIVVVSLVILIMLRFTG